MFKPIAIYQEIVNREIERNELLKDSAYAAFAMSNSAIMEEATKAYQLRMKQEVMTLAKEATTGG